MPTGRAALRRTNACDKQKVPTASRTNAVATSREWSFERGTGGSARALEPALLTAIVIVRSLHLPASRGFNS